MEDQTARPGAGVAVGLALAAALVLSPAAPAEAGGPAAAGQEDGDNAASLVTLRARSLEVEVANLTMALTRAEVAREQSERVKISAFLVAAFAAGFSALVGCALGFFLGMRAAGGKAPPRPRRPRQDDDEPLGARPGAQKRPGGASRPGAHDDGKRDSKRRP